MSGPSALAQIKRRSTSNSFGYRSLQELCDQIGGRLTGSAQDRQAQRWAVKKMRAAGLSNIHLEPWQMEQAWSRGYATAELLAPEHYRLLVDSMGWAGSTPAGGIEAEIVRVDRDRLDEERRDNSGHWAGKVLFLVSGGRPGNSLEAFAQTRAFLNAAWEAHAAAVIGGSDNLSNHCSNLTHTDPVDFSGRVFPLPMVVMAAAHRQILVRKLADGEAVRIKLDVQNQVLSAPAESANVVGEIRGSRFPNQVVLLGAHLDSWDLGQGATDDGFGVASVLQAAQSLVQSGVHPARTLRFVLFTGEEQGIQGSRAYAAKHRAELPDHVAAVVMDQGEGPLTGIQLNGRTDLVGAIEAAIPLVSAGTPLTVDDSLFVFSDAMAFVLAGVPGIDLRQNSSGYSCIHHSAADTFDKIGAGTLSQNATTLALLVFWMADHPQRLGERWPAEDTARMLRAKGAADFLRDERLWMPSGAAPRKSDPQLGR